MHAAAVLIFALLLAAAKAQTNCTVTGTWKSSAGTANYHGGTTLDGSLSLLGCTVTFSATVSQVNYNETTVIITPASAGFVCADSPSGGTCDLICQGAQAPVTAYFTDSTCSQFITIANGALTWNPSNSAVGVFPSLVAIFALIAAALAL